MVEDRGDGVGREPRSLNVGGASLLREFAGQAGDAVDLVVGDDGSWMVLEEASSTVAFAEATEDLLRVTPFLGAEDIRDRMYAQSVGPSSWLDGGEELVVDLRALILCEHRNEVMGLLQSTMEFWSARSSAPTTPIVEETAVSSDSSDTYAPEKSVVEPLVPGPDDSVGIIPIDAAPQAHLSADINAEWSWASSAARIPQVHDVTVDLPEAVKHGRVLIRLHDADLEIGHHVISEGALRSGRTILGDAHVGLSPRIMSQVKDRQAAMCSVVVEDVESRTTLARLDESIDLQPRDLWLWAGDPRRSGQQQVLYRRMEEIRAAVTGDVESVNKSGLIDEYRELESRVLQSRAIARSLLASFSRPNHPEVALVAREAAERLGKAGMGESFHAFQSRTVDEAEKRVEASITAIYDALNARSIAYSDPPPGWDYTSEGQRIRDHGDVARGGLGTCMDTTVLMAAVIEQVGLYPLFVLVPGHIFIAYWRREIAPADESGRRPDWYPDTPVFSDPRTVISLLEGGQLGLIETTAFAGRSDVSANDARTLARRNGLSEGLSKSSITLIDVEAARRAGVSPLPAVNERADGAIEIIEYRGGGQEVVSKVDARDAIADELRERRVDDHPPRYRTWKSALFSLNATNDLLNLKRNASVQPLVLPPEGLGVLEDRLNQDISFSLLSGYDIPAVWQGRGKVNAAQLLDSGNDDEAQDLLGQLKDRKVFVQRIGRVRGEQAALPPATFVKELRSMAHRAKTAQDERGMNPLFLCLGLLRWPHKTGFAEAPLILVPVKVTVTRGRKDLTLSLDATQQTTPNAALLEWLSREHELTIPGLAEPVTDKAGIDVDAVLAEVRAAVSARGLPFDIKAEARLATLDLSAFRMWQDLNAHADRFLERPLIHHLVHTPAEPFVDRAIDPAVDAREADELEALETPVPADATQKQAVLWARQGRTFVLQGPPGTGKSQTITNVVGECLLEGLKVLFVAEKGTALAVVARRLEEIGVGPFALNLHHEGSNATIVRQQLRSALDAAISPDETAMENARRRLRNARFELTQYPEQLHAANAAGLSAYRAHDETLVLGDGAVLEVPEVVVAHDADAVRGLREIFEDLQPWTSAAGVRRHHPWRLAGSGSGDPFDVQVVSRALATLLDYASSSSVESGVSEAIEAAIHPRQLQTLAAAVSPELPTGPSLDQVLRPEWPGETETLLADSQRRVEDCQRRLQGFRPDVLALDLRDVAATLDKATSSGVFGRGKRQAAAVEPLRPYAPAHTDLAPAAASATLESLIAVQDEVVAVANQLEGLARLTGVQLPNLLQPGSLDPLRQRFRSIVAAASPLRGDGDWTRRVIGLAREGSLAPDRDVITAVADAWSTLQRELRIIDADLDVWRDRETLAAAVRQHSGTWRRELDHERLLPLQQWCALVRRLEPLTAAGMGTAREDILDGVLPASAAEDAFARGIAQASLRERMRAAGLDRFDSSAHDARVNTYSDAQAEVRRQWVTDGPARLLEKRGGGGRGLRSGALARELDKPSRRLGTRAILRKYGDVVQELTPLVLCSPASVVDLIDPGVMEFDVVIFDEASQITVPEAMGALGRAKAAVIVGDTKQMPPTRKVGGQQLHEEEIDDPDAEELVEDAESILSECEVARVPTLALSWHYRSQDEALIAFSNKAYYRGELSSFPTPTLLSAETGVEMRLVEGQYIRAGSGLRVDLGNGIVAGANTNPDEAVAIVREVEDMLDACEPGRLPSIGIVTFNEPQRQLIDDLLVSSDHPGVAAVMDESAMGRSEVLFVKPLEQVQGDERDTIIFSIAFSKQGRTIPTNFGPLSNSGGERRLNVAVTRARRKNVVFCSFRPAELNVDNASFKGPQDLKEFLVFADDASSRERPQGSASTTRDRHRDEVAEVLRDHGLHVMVDVGLSDFKLDLVIARPDNPSRPLLPVLLDGESWRRRATVSDRDVLPVEVLKNLMGWPSVARVWWPMWLQNRQRVIDAVLKEVDRAEALLDGKPERLEEVQPAERRLAHGVEAEAEPSTPVATGKVDVPASPAPLTSEGAVQPDSDKERVVSEASAQDSWTGTVSTEAEGRPSLMDEPAHDPEPAVPPTPSDSESPASRRPPAPAPAPVGQPTEPARLYGAQLDTIEPDLSLIDDYTFYDFERDKEMPKELRRIVESVVMDPLYDGRRDSEVALDYTDDLSHLDAEAVETAASRAWDSAIGTQIERKARKVVRQLVADPDYDALPWGDYVSEFLATHLAVTRPGVAGVVERLLMNHAWESGLAEKVQAEIQAEARAVLARMTPLERDVYGFASRNARRLQLAEPYLGQVVERRRPHVIYWMSRIEGEESGAQREARYATAARALQEQGMKRTAISRALGISTSIMDRLQRENRRDVVLGPEDPIVTELAPSLQ